MPLWTRDPESLTLTEEQYDELPDQARKLVEVIDRHVIFCQSGIPEHSDVGHRPEAVKSAEAVHADFHAHRRVLRQTQAGRWQAVVPAARRLGVPVHRTGRQVVIEDPFPAAMTFGDLDV